MILPKSSVLGPAAAADRAAVIYILSSILPPPSRVRIVTTSYYIVGEFRGAQKEKKNRKLGL